MFWSVFLVIGQGSFALADGPVALGPRLIVGSEVVVKVTRTMSMLVPRGSEPTEQKVRSDHQYVVMIDGHEDETSKEVSLEIDSVAIEVAMPGMVMRYDSTDPSTKDAVLGNSFKSLIDKSVDMVFDGDDQFVKMADTNVFDGGGNAPFGQKIGRDEMKQMVRSSIWGGFPEEAVSLGDAWTTRVEVPIPGIGAMLFEMEFSYQSDRFLEDHHCAMVDVKGTMAEESLALPQHDTPETLRRLDDGFESGTFSGVIVVDKELRFVWESDFKVEVVLKMPSPLGQEKVKVPVTQEESMRVVSYRELR